MPPTLLSVFESSGSELQATFSVDPLPEALTVVLESRGGSRGASNERNRQYNEGFELILARLALIGATLTDAAVDSRETARARLSLEERRLQIRRHSYPVTMPDVRDFDDLRKDLCRAQRAIGRIAGATGGNNTKRVRLFIDAPGAQQGISRRSSAVGRDLVSPRT